jgi:hypothetical protein
MNGKLVAPILKETLLGDNDDRVYGVGAQPVKDKIDANLRLAEALLVKDGSVREIFDSFERFDLINKSLVLGREIRLALVS